MEHWTKPVETNVRREVIGFNRWQSVCQCGWSSWLLLSESGAMRAGDEHEAMYS